MPAGNVTFGFPGRIAGFFLIPRVTLPLCWAVVLALLTAAFPVAARAQVAAPLPSPPATQPLLDAGFHAMYAFHFDEARVDFSLYQHAHPDDPLGEVAQSASYLYEEFHRKGIFTSEFFLDNNKFLNGISDAPDKPLCDKFVSLNQRARQMAFAVLKSNPRDANSLFVLTLADGMMSDYDELIIKKQFASLRSMRNAEADAALLLKVEPGNADAYVAIGAANYILGCLPAYKRAFLWLGGIHGDRVRGMNELALAAAHGQYLKPAAEVMLALASLREHQPVEARNLYLQLTHEFPGNPVYASGLLVSEQMVTAQSDPQSRR